MKIAVPTDDSWNDMRLTLIEHPSGMGDQVQVCIHKVGDDPESGTTVIVYANNLFRVARMLEVPYPGADQ